ncbi:MAG: pitrilysin family protein [Bacteroidia bacterium]|nr:pitrilysin family protein [Bacteroidia bacterium]
MIDFDKYTLSNGLQVVVNRDIDTPLVTLNVMYKVGSKDEEPGKTGLAHLLEHCMFTGTEKYPDYDEFVQSLYGENNAFTTTDVTNYYITLPAENIEEAFAIESDRMSNLALFEEGFIAQRSVVMEEMKQTSLNRPYGDYYHLLRSLIYKKHHYQWPTIGADIEHIANATREDLLDFYHRYYTPDNAVVVVSGNVDSEKIFELADRYFGGITTKRQKRDIPVEPKQEQRRELHVEREVPSSKICLAYNIGNMTSRDFYISDLLTDILADGASALLPVTLVRAKRLCVEANASVMDTMDPGFIMFTATANEEENMGKEDLLGDIEREMREIVLSLPERLTDYDFEKAKNRAIVSKTFQQLRTQDKATSLALATLLGDTNLVNTDYEQFASVTAEEIADFIKKTIVPDNECVLYYHKKV